MGSRNMGPEDEYFARRAGEIERERDDRNRREAEPAGPGVEGAQGGQAERKPDLSTEGDERASSILGAMSTAVKGMFGMRRKRTASHG